MEDPETGSLLSRTLLPPPAGLAEALLRVPLPEARERERDQALVGTGSAGTAAPGLNHWTRNCS